jgi:hypothetical protein
MLLGLKKNHKHVWGSVIGNLPRWNSNNLGRLLKVKNSILGPYGFCQSLEWYVLDG